MLQWYDNGGFPIQVEVFLGRSRHKDQSESGITGLNSAMMDKMQACEPQKEPLSLQLAHKIVRGQLGTRKKEAGELS